MFYETQKNLKIRYRSPMDDVISKFYVPVLSDTRIYDRAVGYFSSSVLLSYIDGLENFVKNNGTMRLLISPFLSIKDEEALVSSTKPEKMISESINELFKSYRINGNETEIATQILCKLIQEGCLQIKIVAPRNLNGLFHEKVALFYDNDGMVIATEGSNNETYSAMKENLEAFSVFRSWIQGQDQFIEQYQKDFDQTWHNQLGQYKTISLNEAVNSEILQSYKTDESVENLYQKIRKIRDGTGQNNKNIDSKISLKFTPYDYQVEASEKWLANKKGIIAFATGTGKTKMAIYSIDQLIQREDKKIFVVVVPDKTLVNQWADNDLSVYWDDIIKCFSDNANWKTQVRRKIKKFQAGQIDNPLFIVTTIDTFKRSKKRDDMHNLLKRFNKEYVFIADECHRFGTDSGLNMLPTEVEWRMGLSATPEIYMSPEKTERLFKYFGGIIATYPLEKAIENKKLTPYEYHPIITHLNDKEKESYRDLTHRLIKMLGNVDEDSWDGLSPQAQMLLFNRARIVYGAADKLTQLDNLLNTVTETKNMLVYCGATSLTDDNTEIEHENYQESIRQIDLVTNKLIDHHYVPARYTKDEDGEERKDRIRWFEEGVINVLVAIKALDEGVDIPQIDTGVILASSGNPREFVQRRGRMLRTYPGKEKATIYDMVVLDDEFEGINKTEIKRIFEFSKDALNAEELMDEYEQQFDMYIEKEV